MGSTVTGINLCFALQCFWATGLSPRVSQRASTVGIVSVFSQLAIFCGFAASQANSTTMIVMDCKHCASILVIFIFLIVSCYPMTCPKECIVSKSLHVGL